MKFNLEEVSLCKQIADTGERRALRFGDFWFYPEGEQKIHVVRGEKAVISLMEQQVAGCYPLWTISDCLEFLEKKGLLDDWSVDKEWDEDANQTGNICFWWKPTPKGKDRYTLGKTVLEACLKAVLAVLEEGK